MVQLVDRPPVAVGPGAGAKVWLAIVPPPGMVCFARAAGTNWAAPSRQPAAETLASYQAVQGRPLAQAKGAEALPPDIGAEIGQVEAMHRAILTNQPIEQWRFETVRARYQALLKRAGENPSVEEALRVRLAQVTRHEQAAESARTIQTILARSRRRDLEVAEVRQRLARTDRVHTRGYSAIGFIQPSSRMVEGRKLYALIGGDGSTLAYLDIPPGVDLDSLIARRVGVRGTTHFNEDIGARLVTVRDVEAIQTRR
jgi:hypothetical protein